MRVKAARIAAVFSASVIFFSARGAGAIDVGERPRFTLLREAAPVSGESLGGVWGADDLLFRSAADGERGRALLRPLGPSTLDPAGPAASGNQASGRLPGEGGLRYRLGDAWTAALAYRHALLFGTSPGQILRQQQFSDFATDRDRDVLRLSMSWDLPLAQLNLGYLFESMRAESGAPGAYSLLGVLPESGRTLHALTLGVTRRWGGAGVAR